MHITAVRSGFANNSSSSHSIVINSHIGEFGVNAEGEYGWEDFLLRSRTAKAGYLASQLMGSLVEPFGPRVAALIVRDLLGPDVPVSGYVDHQSQYDLPFAFGRSPRVPDITFAEELTKYLVDSDHIHIAGGNDNQRPEERVYYGDTDDRLGAIPRDGNTGESLVCRKDGQHWTLFNRKSGQKVRLSFVTDEPYVRAINPELCDLKITSYCPFTKACGDFCYQGSDATGRHAENVGGILRSLARLGVFEVALGGGETTSHPEFAQILSEGDRAGMCMNFTTFSMRWANDREIEAAVLSHVRSFAVSVNGGNKYAPDRVDQLAHWKNANKFTGQTSVQAVLELNDPWFFEDLIGRMNRAGLEDLTLLGLKQHGLAAGKQVDETAGRKNLAAVLAVCRDKCVSLSVDTAVVERYKDDLAAAGVNDLVVTDRDGRFSVYIDAVARTAAAHSYGAAAVPILDRYDGVEQVLAANFPFA